MSTAPEHPPSFAIALVLWWKLGWLSFGGPAAQIALMHAELVERRRWIPEASFLHGLNYCMLLPGPEATQLATFLGWRMHGLKGGVAAGTLFVLPGALVIALLAWLYVSLGEVPAVSGVLLGLQAGVLAIIAQAVLRIGKRVLTTPLAIGLAVAALLAMALFSVPFPAVIAGAGVLGFMVGRLQPAWLPAVAAGGSAAGTSVDASPGRGLRWALLVAATYLVAWWLPVAGIAAWLGTDSTTFTQAIFFSKAAVVTFGGAYAVLPYVAQQAVEVHQWLQPGQMMVGLGLAETTPGPLILVLQFVGFVGGWQQPDLPSPLAAALLAAAVTSWVTFIPSFLFVLPVAPWIERLREWPLASMTLGAITAAVVGVIANLGLWFGWQLLSTGPVPERVFAAVVAVVAFWGLMRRGWSILLVVPACAVAGLLFGLVAGWAW
jgi:chromate transporter